MEMPPWTSWPVFHVVMEGLKPRFVLPVLLGLVLVVVVLRRLLQQQLRLGFALAFCFGFGRTICSGFGRSGRKLRRLLFFRLLLLLLLFNGFPFLLCEGAVLSTNGCGLPELRLKEPHWSEQLKP